MRDVLRARVSLLAGCALALLAARMTLVYVLSHHLRGEDRVVVLWQLADDLARTAAHALVASLLALVGALGVLRAPGPIKLAALALGAAGLLSILSGWPVDDPYHVPGLESERGRQGLTLLAVVTLAALGLVPWLVRAAERPGPLGRALRSRTLLAFALVAALAGPLAFAFSFGKLPPTRQVRVRVLEVAFEPELWRAVQERADAPVSLGVVTPSLDYRVDGGDLPALIMPPPAEVRFTVPDEPDGLLLRAAAGVDQRSRFRVTRAGLSSRVGFQIEVDGRRVLDEVVELDSDSEAPPAWRRLPAAGVPLRAGTEVVLRTTLEFELPEGVEGTPTLFAGFGELVLERDVQRQRTRATPRTPNVVLIVMDTLRTDRMSCYGYPIETTPNLDALAARGLIFDEAYATSSWTWPATASILTGLLPEAHRVVSDGSCYLDGRIPSLPEVLGERGYTTAAFTCNPLIVPDKNFDKGFEFFDSSGGFRKTDVILGKIKSWLRMHRRDRFFLYLHLVDPHWSYQPSPEAKALVGLGDPPPGFPPRGIADYHGMLLRGKGHGPDGALRTDELVPAAHREYMDREYDAAVFTSDQYMGELFETLSSLGLDDRTILVFTSDHGEEILDHGLVTHGVSLHPELTRAPLILAGPGIPVGRVGTRVSNRHVAPTIAALAGAEMPGLDHQGGRPGLLDLAGPILLFEPESIPSEPVLFSTHQGWWKGAIRVEIYGMIEGDWEVHHAPQGRPWGADRASPPGDLALYHLPSDPGQHVDLAAVHPERARDMVERMLRHHRATQEAGREVTLGVGGGAERLLRDIGYIGADQDPPPRPPTPNGGEGPR